MAKLKSSFTNMVLVLTGISFFVAVILASTYAATKAPIEATRIAKQQQALKEVLPPFDYLDEPVLIELKGVTLSVYKAFDNTNNFVGAAVESFSKNGFSSEIKIMVGFDKEGQIVNYFVLEQQETPGLGTKMTYWFKPAVKAEKSLVEKLFGFEVKAVEKNSSVVGKNPGRNKLTVSKDGGEIDAITAATISSRAFLEAIQNAYEVFKKIN